jgi:hypothetical protein
VRFIFQPESGAGEIQQGKLSSLEWYDWSDHRSKIKDFRFLERVTSFTSSFPPFPAACPSAILIGVACLLHKAEIRWKSVTVVLHDPHPPETIGP